MDESRFDVQPSMNTALPTMDEIIEISLEPVGGVAGGAVVRSSVPTQSILLLRRSKHRLQEPGFRKGALDSAHLVDDGSWDRPHLIPLGQVGKFCGFHCVPADEIALHGELMGLAAPRPGSGVMWAS